MLFARGSVFFAQLGPIVGSEQGGMRPVVIVQNDAGNRHSPTTIVAPITSYRARCQPTHVQLSTRGTGLAHESVALLEQIRTLDKQRLGDRLGRVSRAEQQEIDRAILVSLGLIPARE